MVGTMTTLTILGSGNMARGIATRALAGGAEVQILDREPGRADDLARQLNQDGARVTAGAIGDPLAGSIVVVAVPYAAAARVLQQYGQALSGRVIVDISNPIDFATFEPVTPEGSSGAEEIATTMPPGADVVKAFNTTFAPTLLAGQVAGEPLDVLIAGDNADGKRAVASFVQAGGLRAIDVGPLARARQLEALGLLHIAMQEPRGTRYGSAVKIVD